jgi:hypothetical protein
MMKHVMIFIMLLALTGAAYSHPENVGKVPNGSVYSCNTCHYSGMFRSDFHSADDQWTAALAAMDSDGDGYSNGTELLDPDGNWSVGDPDPGDPADVTNPDDPDDFPAGTGVDPASFGETKAVFR